MKFFPLQILCIVTTVMLNSNTLYAQVPTQATWPFMPHANFRTRVDYYTAPIAYGYIVKRNKEIITGYIKMLEYYKNEPVSYNIPVLPVNKLKAGDIINVPRADIDYSVLENFPLKNDTIKYVNLDNTDMWAVMGEKNNAHIYFLYQHIKSRDSNEEIILLNKERKMEIYKTTLISIFNPKRIFLRFIRRHYDKNLKMSDFKDDKAMIEYILDKENEPNN